MSRTAVRIAVALLIVSLLTLPVLGYSDGPPEQAGTGPTVQVGCTCHGEGSPSVRAVVSVSGVPIQYENGSSYNLTVQVQDALTMAGESGNTAAGFMLSTGGAGSFSWAADAGIRPIPDSGEELTATSTSSNISHSKIGEGGSWDIVWTAPIDGARVDFWVAGNSVDESSAADAGDHWNVLSFSVLEPGTVANPLSGDALATRTYSVGDHETLFVSEKTADQIEAERQAEIAASVFSRGNLFYWSSLTVLIVAAVVQREVIERRDGTRPTHLAAELGQPQVIRRGVLAAGLFVLGVHWKAAGSGVHLWSVAFFCSAWAAYGVYRTYRAMATPPAVADLM